MFLISGAIALVLMSLLVGLIVPVRLRLAAWTIAILVAVVPWGSWTGHSHWARVTWVPFSAEFLVRDIVLNVILYVPLGFFFVRGVRRNSAGAAVLFALVLSAATELTQVFSHGRFPAMTDVATNVIGAALGVLLARVVPGPTAVKSHEVP